MNEHLEIQTVLLMRIYDVLFGILQSSNKELAEDIMRIHADGTILAPSPLFNGTFIFNELNDEEEVPADL